MRAVLDARKGEEDAMLWLNGNGSAGCSAVITCREVTHILGLSSATPVIPLNDPALKWPQAGTGQAEGSRWRS